MRYNNIDDSRPGFDAVKFDGTVRSAQEIVDLFGAHNVARKFDGSFLVKDGVIGSWFNIFPGQYAAILTNKGNPVRTVVEENFVSKVGVPV